MRRRRRANSPKQRKRMRRVRVLPSEKFGARACPWQMPSRCRSARACPSRSPVPHAVARGPVPRELALVPRPRPDAVARGPVPRECSVAPGLAGDRPPPYGSAQPFRFRSARACPWQTPSRCRSARALACHTRRRAGFPRAAAIAPGIAGDRPPPYGDAQCPPFPILTKPCNFNKNMLN